jgi:RimJ/RimL family protein N-acetyltransferase
MQLTTERLILRNYKTEDWERVHIYGADPGFSKYEFWGPNTIEDTKKFVQEVVTQVQQQPRFTYDLAIFLKDSGLLIGGCGIRSESEQSHVANLGWAVNAEFQNNGYATEAAKALIEFGLQTLKL